MSRSVALVLSAAVVAWGALVVPMPFFEVQPGSARPVEDLLVLSSATGEVDGDLDLLTVRQATPNILEAIWVGLHPDRSLEPEVRRAPVGVDRETYADVQADAFRTSFLTAVVLAAEEAGADVELRTRAVVAQVLVDGPADGLLQPGDEITSLDGVPVDSGTQLVDLLDRSAEPREVELGVLRDGDELDVTVAMELLPDAERPIIGIVVETVASEPDLPFDARLEDTNIVGPSAGMMMALAATDLLLEEDLTRGRTIAGTGTIDVDGRVGRVSGVAQKARAAVQADADLLLVPLEQLDEAAYAAEAGVPVVGVATYDDALEALRGTSPVAAPATD